jgi:hypothetical protein
MSGGWEVAKGPDGHVTGRAQFNEDRTRRQVLIRRWEHAVSGSTEGARSLTWVMLNPSVAGAEDDDATIRKCVGYAKRWGYGAIRVLNLFDLIATDPDRVREHPEPCSPANELAWRTWLFPALGGRWNAIDVRPDVVVAWGDGGRWRDQDQWAAREFIAAGIEPTCLGVTQAGQPLHPGRTSYELQRTPWKVL